MKINKIILVSFRDSEELEWVHQKDFGDLNIIQQYWKSIEPASRDDVWIPETDSPIKITKKHGKRNTRKKSKSKKVTFADDEAPIKESKKEQEDFPEKSGVTLRDRRRIAKPAKYSDYSLWDVNDIW